MSVLRDDQITQALVLLPGWGLEDGALAKRYVFAQGFMGAIGFVNGIAAVAEAVDHHPDIDIRGNAVTLRLSTHSEGGITEKDAALAAECDRVAVG